MYLTARPFFLLPAAWSLLVACQGTPEGEVVREVRAASDEDGPGATTCDGDRFPIRYADGRPVAATLSCCQDGNRTWHVSAEGTLGYRVYGDPCREADGVGTNCGAGSVPFTPCPFGPCGARIEWFMEASDLRVFHPSSMPAKCGWAATGITSCSTSDPEGCDWVQQGERSFPEPFDGQEPYEGVANTCPYTRCRAGGTPIP
jgi:hypothetical protein